MQLFQMLTPHKAWYVQADNADHAVEFLARTRRVSAACSPVTAVPLNTVVHVADHPKRQVQLARYAARPGARDLANTVGF